MEADQVAERWAKAMYMAVHMERHAIEDGGLTDLDKLRDTMNGAIHLGILHSGTQHAEVLLGSAYAMCLALAKHAAVGFEMLDGPLGQSLRAMWSLTTEAQREQVAKLRAAAAEATKGGEPCAQSGH